MTRRLRQAAAASGDRLPANECLFTMIRRWERGDTGVSERYRLHYCRAFDIEPEQFGNVPGAGSALRGGDPAAGAVTWPRGVQWLLGVFGDVRDGLREDAKLCEMRAGQVAADAARAALCRGQALAYLAAAEYVCAALSDAFQGAPDWFGPAADEGGEDG